MESPHNERRYASKICERYEPQQLIREETGMSDGLFRVFKKIGLVLTLGMSMSACAGLFGHTKSWKEEVVLHDGKVIVVERFFNLGDYPTLDSHNRSPLDQTLTFTLPDSNKTISWKTEYRNELPKPNSLTPLLVDVVGGVPYVATSPAGCISYNKWGRPNPPYVLFKYANDEWKHLSLEEFPAELFHANLMSEPDIRILKSYYSVEQVKEQMNGRRIAAEATTILREAIPESQLCTDWNLQRYRSPKAPLPMKPSNEK
jgi:hypothetical protein